MPGGENCSSANCTTTTAYQRRPNERPELSHRQVPLPRTFNRRSEAEACRRYFARAWKSARSCLRPFPGAVRHALPPRRLDCPPGHASCARQPHECLYPLQTGAHRAEPTIKPYEQQLWAELEDTRSTPIEVSLTLMDSLHDRWVRLLRSLTPEAWKRTFRHPELGVVSLEKNLALYAWHGKHHVAHITGLRQRNGW
jgi:hypothetical protein